MPDSLNSLPHCSDEKRKASQINLMYKYFTFANAMELEYASKFHKAAISYTNSITSGTFNKEP